MLRQTMKQVMFASVTCVAALIAPLVASAVDISDEGGFFSPEAVAKANQAIRELETKTGHQVRIETHAAVPSGKSDAVAKMDKAERETFFSNWVHERAAATQSRGLIVFICKTPAHVRIWAGNPLQLAGFGEAQVRPIREALMNDLRAKEYDKALADTVAQVTTSFAGLKHASSQPTAAPLHRRAAGPISHAPAHAPQSSGFGGVFWVMAIVLGGVLLFSVISRMLSGGGGYAPQNPYGAPGMGYGGGYGPGGGGFMRSLAGGIFGAMAGNWLYDQFSGHHAHASDSGWSNTDPSGSDYTSGGSDSGFSGGTDFGGGDFSGGDSGGGSDFGGGGDF